MCIVDIYFILFSFGCVFMLFTQLLDDLFRGEYQKRKAGSKKSEIVIKKLLKIPYVKKTLRNNNKHKTKMQQVIMKDGNGNNSKDNFGWIVGIFENCSNFNDLNSLTDIPRDNILIRELRKCFHDKDLTQYTREHLQQKKTWLTLIGVCILLFFKCFCFCFSFVWPRNLS